VNGALVDITTSRSLNQICGATTTLSPFGVLRPSNPVPSEPDGLIYGEGSIEAAHRQHNFLVLASRRNGRGRWNGHDGYSFEATASDRGEPGRNREAFSLVVRDARGVIVASVSGALDDGNIQSVRVDR
jgi:hypothetical protein